MQDAPPIALILHASLGPQQTAPHAANGHPEAVIVAVDDETVPVEVFVRLQNATFALLVKQASPVVQQN
jgi:hypothetical protein